MDSMRKEYAIDLLFRETLHLPAGSHMNFSIADWIAGTVILCGTLLIPVAIRWWILKRPLTKVSGGIIAVVTWAALFLFFYWAASLVDQQDAYARKGHVGIMLIALATYWILVSDRKRPAIQDRENKLVDSKNEKDSEDENIKPPAIGQAVSRSIFPAHIVLLIVGIGIGYVGSVVINKFNTPQTYDECILKLMPAAQTREAALFIRTSCDNKHKSIIEIDPFDIVIPKEEKTDE